MARPSSPLQPPVGLEPGESAMLSSPTSLSSPRQPEPVGLTSPTSQPLLPPSPQHSPSPIAPNSLSNNPRRPADNTALEAHNSTAQPAGNLTFFQKYFTKPTNGSPEKTGTGNRRFSFLSLGFIVSAIAMLILLIVVATVAAVETVKTHHSPHRGGHGGPINPINPLDPTSPTNPNNTNSEAPVRAAILENFPDPSIWYDNGLWYAYATNNGAGIIGPNGKHNATKDAPDTAHAPQPDTNHANVQLATSTDYVTWSVHNASNDPLPEVGAWARQGVTDNAARLPKSNVWAPAITQRAKDKKYVLYYSALSSDALPANIYTVKGHHPPPHCVGAAISDSPLGPFNPVNASIACPLAKGGAIDPAVITDTDGTIYVAWKVDGNNIGNGGQCGNMVKPTVPTPIMLLKMNDDGVNANGEPVQILTNEPEDGPLVEAPALVRSPEGVYFLFFSSGCTRFDSYNVKYATAPSITGPYTRAKKPLLQTGDYDLTAPGSVGIHSDGKGGFNMAFHGRVLVDDLGVRAMFTTGLTFDKDIVTLVRATNSSSSS